MRTTRVYHPGRLQVGRDACLEERASHHLAKVLRMRPGDAVTLFDGSGGEHYGVIHSVDRGAVRVRVDRFDPVERESVLRTGLGQVVSAGERMDLTVQKAVELGVVWIQPLLSRRAKVRLDGDRALRRVAHWQRVAASACEQSGRNRVPEVRPLLALPDWLGEAAAEGTRLMLDPAADTPLSGLRPPQPQVTLLAGGESGFEPEEIRMAALAGFLPVRLGPRVLRTETAGLAALAAMQALWGDF